VFIRHRGSFFRISHESTMPDGNTPCNSVDENLFALRRALPDRSVYVTEVME
jgi:hypothetical protein